MGEKNQTNKQYNKRPDAGRPKVEEMYLAEEVILRSVQTRNFEEILVLPKAQPWRPYIPESQQRPCQKWKVETDKLTFQTWFLTGPKRVSQSGGPTQESCHSFWGESSNHHHPKWVTSQSFLSDNTRAKTSSTWGRGIAHNALRKASYWIINGRSFIAHEPAASPKDGKPFSRTAYFCPSFHVYRHGRFRPLVHKRESKRTRMLGYNLYMSIVSSH